MKDPEAWPALPFEQWADTRRTLHMVTQMIGKVRLALAPPLPEWQHASLSLNGRGLTTGAVPFAGGVIELAIDLFEPSIAVDRGNGRRATISLVPPRSVADIWVELEDVLTRLGIAVSVSDQPQEVGEAAAFRDDRHTAFDPAQAQQFHRVLGATNGVFEAFRSPFFGRTSLSFWWGSFDFCVMLFTGRRIPAPQNRGYILRYDLDAEHLNAGFWPGDERTPEPRFYAYLVPRPDGCNVAPIEPASAAWAAALGEWVLPYEQVRASPDPPRAVLDFLRSVYRVAVDLGGWDADRYRYLAPRAARRPSADE